MEYVIDTKTMKLAYIDALVIRVRAGGSKTTMQAKGMLPSPSHMYLANVSRQTSGLDTARRFANNLPISEL